MIWTERNEKEWEAKKAGILATYLFVFAKKNLNLDYQEIYHFLVDRLDDMEFPTMCLATARWIASESDILYLDQLALTKAILRAHRKRYPIDYTTTTVETSEKRRCSKCQKWKYHIEFSETSRLCRLCKQQIDHNRPR